MNIKGNQPIILKIKICFYIILLPTDNASIELQIALVG